jgi:hypothetical protein
MSNTWTGWHRRKPDRHGPPAWRRIVTEAPSECECWALLLDALPAHESGGDSIVLPSGRMPPAPMPPRPGEARSPGDAIAGMWQDQGGGEG